MKISNRIFWGFWAGSTLLVLLFMGLFSMTTRAWISPEGKQLKDATSLTGPWQEQAFSNRDFSSLKLKGAFDVTWEQSDTYEVVVFAPERFKNRFEVKQQGSRLVFENQLSGRFKGLALRLKIKSPGLTEIEARSSLKLGLTGNPGTRLLVSSLGAMWVEGHASEPVNNLEIMARGMCVLHLKDFPLKNLDVHIEGHATVVAHVTESLSGNVHGEGTLLITGNPPRQRLINTGKVRIQME